MVAVYYYDFWRSCDTEDWSNDAENTALINAKKLDITIYSYRKLRWLWELNALQLQKTRKTNLTMHFINFHL